MRTSRKRRRRLIIRRHNHFHLKLLVAVALTAVALSCRTAPAPPPDPGLDYVELLTAGAASEAELPMVVAIHGLGATPENFAPLFESFPEPARILLPRGPMEHGEGYSWFAMSAGTDRTAQLREAADKLATFLEAASRLHPTTGRPIVTGFSQGGMLSFALALEHAELLGGAMPLAGMIPKAMLDDLEADAAGATPRQRLVALHGGADRIFGADGIRRSVAALSAKGIKTELYVYPGVGHQVSDRMRDDIYLELAAMISPPTGED